MAKKKASNQPIVSEEPLRPEEQFRLDEAGVAPPSSRPIGPRNTPPGGAKSYSTRSASERRAARSSARGNRSSSSRSSRRSEGIRPDIVMNMLENPTIVVTEEQLRHDYSYVTSDLRSMAVLAVALIVALIVLAEVLPK